MDESQALAERNYCIDVPDYRYYKYFDLLSISVHFGL
jgi:hypothetical protein